MPFLTHATAFTPGSIGNLGPGLDVLGCAVEGAGDAVTAEWCQRPGISIADSGHPDLPTDVTQHAAGIAALAIVRRATTLGATTPADGITLSVRKGLPLAAGQGGSAASAVAGAAAVNALIGSPLKRNDLLAAALAAEESIAGRHLDNIAPALMGGIVLVRSLDPIDVVQLPVPDGLRIVLAHPSQSLRTSDARAVLPDRVARDVAMHQAAQVGAIVAACFTSDLDLLGRSIDDRIAEPVRAGLLPGFAAARTAALDAGALGVSISGAGPTIFALCGEDQSAAAVATAVCAAYERSGLACVARVTRPDLTGTRVDASSSHRST
ncbi:MAG TPA: homoserine kinase [Gemmatimonadaceae bacterium]